ncbi:MAG: hotdog domain-containing protein [Acidobacteriota bacterium]
MSDDRSPSPDVPQSPTHHKSGPVQPAIRVMLMPKDTNGMGTIFGGIILSYIDLAGAVEARRYARGPVVTAAMREVEFHQPVFVGDIVSFHTETLEIGCTSVTVRVMVEAERKDHSRATVRVTEAEVVYVHIDSTNRPTPLDESLVRAAGLEPRCS